MIAHCCEWYQTLGFHIPPNLKNTHICKLSAMQKETLKQGEDGVIGGTRKQRGKEWSRLCHVGRKALPWHSASLRGGGGLEAAAVFTRRKRRRPEGYPPCWIAAVLHTVKERRGEVCLREKEVNPSLTPCSGGGVWSAARVDADTEP